MGDEYHLPADQERAGVPRHTSHYDILQPQFKQPARQIAPRDRYRVKQYENPMYDVVEDDGAYVENSHFDSFGMPTLCLFGSMSLIFYRQQTASATVS
jgi:ATP-dependent DNA helicase HFM1/MER3